MAETIGLNKNVVSAKKLAGIANFVKTNSEASYLSAGSEVITVEQEIRDTKKAQVLLPLLTGIIDIKEVLKQAKSGGVQLSEAELNEFIIELANEKATKPMIWRPRDGEVIGADALLDRYKGSFEITSTVAKDQAFYSTLLSQGVAGVELAVGGTSLKAKVVSAVLKATDVKEKAFEFSNLIRTERVALKMTKDKFTQQTFTNKDFVIVVNGIGEVHLENDARYNMYTEKAQTANGILSGSFDGSDVIVSKRLPADVDFIIMLKGSATSLFMLRNKMNADKIVGADAYAVNIEFDEGTGVWLPHMITFGSADITKVVPQDKVGFDALALTMADSVTTSGNKTGSAGIVTTTK